MVSVNKINFTEKLKKSQDINAEVQKLIKNLPKNLDETAKKHGAIIRRRKVSCAVSLFLAIAQYIILELSQTRLAATFADTINMTDQAWQKKIVRCEPWLSHLLCEIMPKIPLKRKKSSNNPNERTIKLIDASIFQQAGHKNGKGGKSLRLHMCYNLTAGKMDSVKLTENTVAESVSHFPTEKGAIYIADSGYGKGKQLSWIVQNKADALFRLSPSQIQLVSDANGKTKIDMNEKLKTTARTLDFNCFIQTEKGKYMPVRIVATRLPEDKALLAKERKKNTARKNQNKIQEKTLIYAEWTILMTSLGSDYSAEKLFILYRSRWQIELLFKRIKQAAHITKLRPASLEHSKVAILMILVLWVLIERNTLAAELFLSQKEVDIAKYSIWSTSMFMFQRLKATLSSVALAILPSDPPAGGQVVKMLCFIC